MTAQGKRIVCELEQHFDSLCDADAMRKHWEITFNNTKRGLFTVTKISRIAFRYEADYFLQVRVYEFFSHSGDVGSTSGSISASGGEPKVN